MSDRSDDSPEDELSYWFHPRSIEDIRRFVYQEFDRPCISPDILLQEGLDRYPKEWLNRMLRALKRQIPRDPQAKRNTLIQSLTDPNKLLAILGTLGPSERTLLDQLLTSGGWLSYQTVVNQYGEEVGDSMWYNEFPASTIGRLRIRALVFVGTSKIGPHEEKRLVIPQDLRDRLRSALAALASLDHGSPRADGNRIDELGVSLTNVVPKRRRRLTVLGSITLTQRHDARER